MALAARCPRLGAQPVRRVEKQRLHWPILDAFLAAAVEAGLPRCDDFNRGDNEGVGYFDVNQRGGIRWNAAKGFLRPALARDNLQVWTGAHISRVLLERGDAGLAAVGVEVIPRGGGERIRAHATREVVLATGAIGTPQLKMMVETTRIAALALVTP